MFTSFVGGLAAALGVIDGYQKEKLEDKLVASVIVAVVYAVFGLIDGILLGGAILSNLGLTVETGSNIFIAGLMVAFWSLITGFFSYWLGSIFYMIIEKVQKMV